MNPMTIDYQGEVYRLGDRIGLAPLIRFGKLAKDGADSFDPGTLSVMYDVLEQCFAEAPYCRACGSTDTAELSTDDADKACCDGRRVVESEFERWLDAATKHRADQDEIMEVVGKAIQAIANRPTGRSAASSAGPPTTSTSFEDASSLRAQHRLETAGRADLAVAVLRRREALAG